MLDLQNILWVVPGVVFIYFYNRIRPAGSISVSGWPYLFLLVIVAIIAWLPAEFITSKIPFSTKIFFQVWITSFISAIFSILLLWLCTASKSIEKWIFPSVLDNFYNKCVEWENEEILLTLRNGKSYHGILWKFPENPKSRHESQTISIIPFKSGYRDEKTKEVVWNTYYLEYKNKTHLVDMETIIPRSEIINFGKFSKETFKHFEKQHP